MPMKRTQLAAVRTMQPPTGGAQAALILDMDTGRPLVERNARTRFAPASITKIMTAVLTMERGSLTDKVTVQADDLVEGSTMGLQAGDVVTVEDLLWGLLLPSGNDAAETLARYLGGGSVQKFVGMMNEKAQALGLSGTHYANPHGLDDPDHYSTAYDLGVLSRYAMQKPLFAKIAVTKEYTVRAARPYVLRNTNQLLFLEKDVPGVTGVKTGFTDRAGDSLVASAEREGRRVIVVVLGTTNRTAAAANLIDFAYRYYAWVPLTPAGLIPDTLPVGAANEPAMVPAWQRYYVRYYVEPVPASGPRAASVPVGVLHCYVGRDEIARQALYASAA